MDVMEDVRVEVGVTCSCFNDHRQSFRRHMLDMCAEDLEEGVTGILG